MKLDVNKVLKREAERKAEVKPLPVVRVIKSGHRSEVAKRIMADTPPEVIESSRNVANLKVQLHQEFTSIKKERAKLSTRTAFLVKEVREKLLNENPRLAGEFDKGHLPSIELEHHYQKIQDLTDQAAKVYDKIRYVEQYGELPPEGEPQKEISVASEDPQNVLALKQERRTLNDLLHKTRKKLVKGKPKNIERIGEWKLKIALAEARRDEIEQQLKRINYGARAERAGEE